MGTETNKFDVVELKGKSAIHAHLVSDNSSAFPDYGGVAHRAYSKLRRWFPIVIWDGLASLAITISGTAVAFSGKPSTSQKAWLIGGLALFLLFKILFWIGRYSDRKLRNQIKVSIIKGILQKTCETIVKSEVEPRITWFEPDPIHPRIISPTIRIGDHGAKPKSVHYAECVGITGLAHARPLKIWVHKFPIFKNRDDMENYYLSTLKMPKSTVDKISDHMVNVRTIVSIGIARNDTNESMGVLSIDFLEEWKQSNVNIEIKELLIQLRDTLLAFEK